MSWGKGERVKHKGYAGKTGLFIVKYSYEGSGTCVLYRVNLRYEDFKSLYKILDEAFPEYKNKSIESINRIG